jgi:hypothetical protein
MLEEYDILKVLFMKQWELGSQGCMLGFPKLLVVKVVWMLVVKLSC